MNRPLGLALRGLALLGVAAVVAIAYATKAAHRAERVDEAGVVLVAVVALGVLWLSFTAWRAAATPVAATSTDAAVVGDEDDALVVDRVTVRYGTRLALDDVSFRVRRGEIVGLLGPNGAGKTTAVDVCCGLRRPNGGSASVFGVNARHGGAELRLQIGVVPQESGLYPELTGEENLELFAALYHLPDAKARITEVLTLLGLNDRRTSRVGTYSGGMKRRLALARALLHQPKVLFLDEPTLGVDVHGRRALWDHIASLRDEGRAVLLTTNYLEEATALCDRVVIVDGGRVIADESPDTLRRQAGTTLLLDVADPAAAANAVGDGASVDGETVRVRLARNDLAAAAVNAASAVTTVRGIRTEEPSLEDVFLRLTGPRE